MIRKELDWLEHVARHSRFLKAPASKYKDNAQAKNSFRDRCCDLLLAYATKRFETANYEDETRWQRLDLLMGSSEHPIHKGASADQVFHPPEDSLYKRLSSTESIFEFHEILINAIHDRRAGKKKLREILKTLQQIVHKHLTDDSNYGFHIETSCNNKLVAPNPINKDHPTAELQDIGNATVELIEKLSQHTTKAKNEYRSQSQNLPPIPYQFFMRHCDELYQNDETKGPMQRFMQIIDQCALEKNENDEQLNDTQQEHYRRITNFTSIDLPQMAGIYSMKHRKIVDKRITRGQKLIENAESDTQARKPRRETHAELHILYNAIISAYNCYDKQNFVRKIFRKANRQALMNRLYSHAQMLKENADTTLPSLEQTLINIQKINDPTSSLVKMVNALDLLNHTKNAMKARTPPTRHPSPSTSPVPRCVDAAYPEAQVSSTKQTNDHRDVNKHSAQNALAAGSISSGIAQSIWMLTPPLYTPIFHSHRLR